MTAMRRGVMGVALCLLLVVAAAAALAQTTTIRFHYRGGGARTEVVQAWIQEFERRNPDIKVEWEQPTGDWQDKLIVAMATGTAPDVVEFWGSFGQQLARNGWLLDLRPYVERDMTEEDIADFFPAAWEGTFVQHGPHAGEQFALPRYINTMVTYYNKTLIEQAGLETPTQLYRRGDWTWQTLRESSRKLTRTVEGETVQWGYMTMTRHWERMAQFLWENGTDWFDPADPTRFTGDSPEALEVMNFLYEMIWEEGIAYRDLDWNLFWNGQVAMQDDGIAVIFSRHDASIQDSFDWDIATRPAGPNGAVPWATDDSLGIWAGSQHPEAAWRFIQFITSTEGQEIMVRIEGLAPVRRSATPAFIALDDRFDLGVFIENMLTARSGAASRVPGDIDAIGSALAAVLRASLVNNEKPYAVAIEEAKPNIEAIVRETAQ